MCTGTLWVQCTNNNVQHHLMCDAHAAEARPFPLDRSSLEIAARSRTQTLSDTVCEIYMKLNTLYTMLKGIALHLKRKYKT